MRAILNDNLSASSMRVASSDKLSAASMLVAFQSNYRKEIDNPIVEQPDPLEVMPSGGIPRIPPSLMVP
jgi:hypothetical protein